MSRKEPFRLIGPVGAKSLMTNLESAYALDIKIRLEDEKLPPEGIATVVEEFEKDGIVYDEDGVRVIAFTVDHGEAIKPAVGYRIEYKGRAVVISGDTRYNQNVIKYSTASTCSFTRSALRDLNCCQVVTTTGASWPTTPVPRSWTGVFVSQAETSRLSHLVFSRQCGTANR